MLKRDHDGGGGNLEKGALTSTMNKIPYFWTPLARRTKSGSRALKLMPCRPVGGWLDEGWGGEPPIHRAIMTNQGEGNRTTRNLVRG